MPFTRIIALALGAFLATFAWASEMPVPVRVQLPLFTKIWKLDRSFSAPTVTLAIVYQQSHGPSVKVKREVTSWIEREGRLIRAVSVAIDIEEGLDTLRTIDADVFYIAPMRGADIRRIAQIARERNIRTNTGVPDYVTSGIGVAIGVRNDRPLIVINVPGSKAEGASFPAQLLQLSRMVQ
jgi:hypothetical protein